MPRLSVHHTTSGVAWNEHVDYCKACYPNPRQAAATWGDDVDMDNEHPDYTLDEYTCESCGRQLGNRDN